MAIVTWRCPLDNRPASTYVVKPGGSDVWLLLRPGVEPPFALPLPRLEIPCNAIVDLSKILGVDASKNVIFEENGHLRKFSKSAKSNSNFSGVDVLGMHSGVTISPQGYVISVSEIGSFDFIDPSDFINIKPSLESPPDAVPFWNVGANSVSSNQDSFIVGGYPLLRIDQYNYKGRLTKTFDGITTQYGRVLFSDFGLEKIQIDRRGRIWGTNGIDIFIMPKYESLGTIFRGMSDEIGFDLDLMDWFDVDSKGVIWTVEDGNHIGFKLKI
jgi:hypothetical protein